MKLAILAIDIQNLFIEIAVTANMASVLKNSENFFEVAGKSKIPFFITFENNTTGEYGLPEQLAEVLPHQASLFIINTFAATGLNSFVAALQDEKISHLFVIGSETAVCVMQTVLGLKN